MFLVTFLVNLVNLDINKLFDKLSNIIDNIQTNNIYGENYKKTNVIEVDIKKQIAIDKASTKGLKSEEYANNSESKLDKLRKLRRGN